jgi:hypothetical protein
MGGIHIGKRQGECHLVIGALHRRIRCDTLHGNIIGVSIILDRDVLFVICNRSLSSACKIAQLELKDFVILNQGVIMNVSVAAGETET